MQVFNELQICECLSVDTLTVDIRTYLRIWSGAEQKVTTLLGALQYLVLVHVVGGSYKLRHLLAQE